ncbi:E3 ubiquitin-protein ligase sspH2 [compost metagenome]
MKNAFILLLCFLFLNSGFHAQTDSENENIKRDLNEAFKQPLEVEEMILSDQETLVLPDSMDRFKNMTWFEARDCGLKEIPASLCNLNQLMILALVGNQLTSLPENFGNLENLGLLDLTDNQLKSLPVSLCSLKQLTQLALDNNQFTEFPVCITGMKEMMSLSLQGNKLTKIPEEIGQLQNLGLLFLMDNQITTLPESISRLKDLQFLDLRGNPISEQEQKRILKLVPKDCEVLFQ